MEHKCACGNVIGSYTLSICYDCLATALDNIGDISPAPLYDFDSIPPYNPVSPIKVNNGTKMRLWNESNIG